MSAKKSSFTDPAPEANFDPNQRLGELALRDLAAILGYEIIKEENLETFRKIRPGSEVLHDPASLLNKIEKVIEDVAGLKDRVDELFKHVSASKQNPPKQ